MSTDIDLPDGWRELERYERHSTISHFLTGWKHEDGREVLVWEGVQVDGEYVLETHLHDEAPEDAGFIIEVLEPDPDSVTQRTAPNPKKELTRELFAASPAGAINQALNIIRN